MRVLATTAVLVSKADMHVWLLCSGKEDLVWYTLLLCTSDKPAAGTDADVFVTIHGTEGSSPRVKLPSRPEDFLRGSTDTFRMQLKALGQLAKLTVGHNNRGNHPGWHLDHAEVTDEATGEIRVCGHMHRMSLTNAVFMLFCVSLASLPAWYLLKKQFCMHGWMSYHPCKTQRPSFLSAITGDRFHRVIVLLCLPALVLSR